MQKMDKFEIQCCVIILFKVNYVLIMQKKKKLQHTTSICSIAIIICTKNSYDLLKIAELKKIINASN